MSPVPDAAPSPLANHAPPSLPLWARVVDALSLVIALIALSVLLFGGFRIWLFETRLSVTTWWRPALAALLLIGLRHAVIRRGPLPARVGGSVRRGWASPVNHTVVCKCSEEHGGQPEGRRGCGARTMIKLTAKATSGGDRA